jgi:hypothetical protein
MREWKASEETGKKQTNKKEKKKIKEKVKSFIHTYNIVAFRYVTSMVGPSEAGMIASCQDYTFSRQC